MEVLTERTIVYASKVLLAQKVLPIWPLEMVGKMLAEYREKCRMCLGDGHAEVEGVAKVIDELKDRLR
jgi:hypothetical protein